MDKLISVLEETNQLLAQHLGNNVWEWISIVVSILAVICAAVVPARIAHKQNQIALFEKRFSAYSNMVKLKSFANMLSLDECSFAERVIRAAGVDFAHTCEQRSKEILRNFQVFFHDVGYGSEMNDVAGSCLCAVRALELSLHTLPLLYSSKLENEGKTANEEITSMFRDLTALMIAIATSPQKVNDQNRVNFVLKMNEFDEKYAEKFEAELRLLSSAKRFSLKSNSGKT